MPAVTQSIEATLAVVEADYHPGLSIDCVIFGFHDGQLKVLLLETRYSKCWALAGGYVRSEEDVDHAAIRVLRARTGLTDIFLRQFHVFGEAARITIDQERPHPVLSSEEAQEPQRRWISRRFVSIGYYALVDFALVQPQPGGLSKACAWFELSSLPELIYDHQRIITKALETLRQRLGQEPIGYKLLPEKFTMPELQKLHEAILSRALDRRNFQRRLLSYGILRPLNERRTGGAHKAPLLYSFDAASYELALAQGLQNGW